MNVSSRYLNVRLLFFLYLFYLPVTIFSQDIQGIEDLDESEYLRYQQIKENLIDLGYLEQQPAAPVAFQSTSEDSFLFHAWYMEKNLPLPTTNTRTSDFSPDGTRFYVVAREELIVSEYHLSEEWDITTASFVRDLDLSSELGTAANPDATPHGIYIKQDTGRTMWIFNRVEIWEYTLSSPWNISTATPSGYNDLTDLIVRGHGIDFKPDGTVLYVDDRILGAVFQFDLTTPWDIETATLDYVLDISSQQRSVRGNQFNPQGNRIFLLDTGNNAILEYTLTTPYELRSASFHSSYSVSEQITSPEGMKFRPDFDIFYITATTENTILQYKISTIDPDGSTVRANISELDANGMDRSRITVTLSDSDGDRFVNYRVNLMADGGSAMLDNVRNVTNSSGRAVFDVFSANPETVTYTATALRQTGDVIISENATVTFLPEPPILLSSTNVESNNFTINWEIVNNASGYLIDLSSDESFTNYVGNYESLDVGFVTSHTVSGIEPGSYYYYRVRSEGNGLESRNSIPGEVLTFPEVPAISAPANVLATRFTARWQPAPGAREYFLDVGTDETFTEFVDGYEDLNIGNQFQYEVTGLSPGTSYFYRVRSQAFTRTSDNSSVVQSNTLGVNLELTDVSSSQLRVLANGIQENLISITLRDTDGNPIPGEKIIIEPESGASEVSEVTGTTDGDGQAVFAVSNTVAETVLYRALVGETFEIGSVSMEFLPFQGELTLGNNYPNPFSGSTTIPLIVPHRMHVKIDVYNLLGSYIQTVINEELNQGYYEIPVTLHSSAAGVFFYRLFAKDEVETLKMLHIK